MDADFSRRRLLSTAGLAAVAVPLANRAPALVRRPDQAGAPGPVQVHVQFGADAASQVAVSWAAAGPVARPRLRLGQAAFGFGLDVPAQVRTYAEALTGEVVWTYHARLDRLVPDTSYVYQVLHDGAAPVEGTFRTGPRGGTLPGSGLLTPAPQGSDPDVMDTSDGAVHMIIGGGGHSFPTLLARPRSR
jgi:phosphodiesterase/alkaline phosphatase D-like protein